MNDIRAVSTGGGLRGLPKSTCAGRCGVCCCCGCRCDWDGVSRSGPASGSASLEDELPTVDCVVDCGSGDGGVLSRIGRIERRSRDRERVNGCSGNLSCRT